MLNLVADKARALAEAYRVLRPGGRPQFADIAVGRSVPEAATCDIGLWTDCIAGGRSLDEWVALIRGAGFGDVRIGPAVDTFGGTRGERNARRYAVSGHAFAARKPA
ncbi:hypothetical protein L600_001100000820 [Isoptericola variabilis J7]|nr:hypothetical protein [Isoptericola variabilis]TWH34600.1 hypothetical protein L600_001100000820 [Isoptericola variabilis J7]